MKRIITICQHEVNIKFSWWCCVPFVQLSYWSMFHINIMTGSGVMTIFFNNGLTRNPEIGNTTTWVLPNNWRLRQVRDIKFGTNVSFHKSYWMLRNAKVTAYINKGEEGKITSSTQIRVKKNKKEGAAEKGALILK